MGRMRGERVDVLYPLRTVGEDREPSVEWASRPVDDVLVAPGPTSGEPGGNRPGPTTATLTLAFPKKFKGSLRGCRVVVRGEEFDVVGDPRPNQEQNCPTRWWLTAEVRRALG